MKKRGGINMAEYSTQTIKELIGDIKKGRVVLPAIQRNFVWPEEKVYHLFDSLMRDYPIGTFLFWEIDDEAFSNYVFNTFIQNYDEQKGKMQRGDRANIHYTDYKAVLDGQQRITSIYIGTCGKYRVHIPHRRWDDPTSYYDKYLCLDILNTPGPEDKYHFEFKTTSEIEKRLDDENDVSHYWVKVSTAFEGYGAGKDEADYIDEIIFKNPGMLNDEKRPKARSMLKALNSALSEKPNVNYYPAKNMELAKVVDIFVRVNSGGEKLNSSDLMLSVAAGEQGDVDVHKKLQEAIDEINSAPADEENGFVVDKELILTAGLMLTEAESLSLSKSANYSHERMNAIFKEHWDDIVEALKNTVQYVEYIGFIGRKLSKNIILPIAYYFYRNKLNSSHKTSSSNRACCDRIFIRQWLLRAIINDVFMEGTGSTLLTIRNVIDKTDRKHFPLEDLMQKEIKKSLKIEETQINEIIEIKYGDSKIVPIFGELLHVLPSRNEHVDHIWPKAILSSKKAIRKNYPTASEDFIEFCKDGCHSIVNLQLLDGLKNQQKSDTEYDKWITATYLTDDERKRYCEDHFIPQDESYEIRNLQAFWEKRKMILREKIAEAFPSDFYKLVERYSLQDKI